MLMTNKLNRVVSYHEVLPPIKPHELLITYYCEITHITRVPMATKRGRMVNYLE